MGSRWRAGTLRRLLVVVAFNTAMLVWLLYLGAAYDRAVDCPSGNYMTCTGGNQGVEEIMLGLLSVVVWVIGDIVLARLWVRAVRGRRGRPRPGLAAQLGHLWEEVEPGTSHPTPAAARPPEASIPCPRCGGPTNREMTRCPHCRRNLWR